MFGYRAPPSAVAPRSWRPFKRVCSSGCKTCCGGWQEPGQRNVSVGNIGNDSIVPNIGFGNRGDASFIGIGNIRRQSRHWEPTGELEYRHVAADKSASASLPTPTSLVVGGGGARGNRVGAGRHRQPAGIWHIPL